MQDSRNNKDLEMKDEKLKTLDAYYTEAKEIHNQSRKFLTIYRK
jgi:hypothetical protein